MGKVDSLQRGVGIWTALEARLKGEMKDFKQAHKVTWWLRPSYWKIEKEHHKAFLSLINYRTKYATAVKEKESSSGR